MKSLLPFHLLKVYQPVFRDTPPDSCVVLFIYFFDAQQMPALLWVHSVLNDNKYSNYAGVGN